MTCRPGNHLSVIADIETSNGRHVALLEPPRHPLTGTQLHLTEAHRAFGDQVYLSSAPHADRNGHALEGYGLYSDSLPGRPYLTSARPEDLLVWLADNDLLDALSPSILDEAPHLKALATDACAPGLLEAA